MKGLHLIIVLWAVGFSFGQTVYFLAADPNRTESYVVPISNSAFIDHARDLIEFGPSAGFPIIIADISCGPDGVNRDYLSPTVGAWKWHITNVVGFDDMTQSHLDGSPGLVNSYCSAWLLTGGQIGFENFSIVEELGEDLDWYHCDYNRDQTINLEDFALFALQWLQSGCKDPNWCEGADTDQSELVDLVDLQHCSRFWLMPRWPSWIWFDAWDCPTQCYGNADCQSQWVGGNQWAPVLTADIMIYYTVLDGTNWPAVLGDVNYDPRADFDRDFDVDDDDGVILNTWFGVDESQVPTDCQMGPV